MPRCIVLLLLLLGHVFGWDLALEITTQAGGAYGGEPFQTQPILAIKNLQGELQTAYEGRVTVQLLANNANHATLRKEGDDTISNISRDVINGIVAFSGLSIDKASDGYQLQFTLHDEYDLVMDKVTGEQFAVEVGNRFALEITSQPESAYGGSVFGNQPALAIIDRGGNIVTDVNEGTVNVSLLKGNDRATLQCISDEEFVVPIIDGLINFAGLYINEADAEYTLKFATELSIDGSREVVSDTFSVGIGSAAHIVLVQDASSSSVFGGKAFTSQPRVEVHDMGGNVVRADSSSAVRVSFYSNPSGGVISPMHATTGYLKDGVVQFRGLSIDKAGKDYRLKYSFLMYEGDELISTAISTLGLTFDVEVGQAYQLSIIKHGSGGWAGNQPFITQPVIALVDAGGNIVTDESAASITAEVTPSISHSSYIIVDTTNDDVPGIDHTLFGTNIIADDRTVYGPGDVIEIVLTFTQEVSIYPQNDDDHSTLPRLALNVLNNGSVGEVYAELTNPSQQGYFTDSWLFKYAVSAHDSQIELDYLSVNALQFNDYVVEDAFGRSADVILPAVGAGSSLSNSKAISISDSSPTIISIEADLPDGDYEFGAGHVIEIIVSFDREVAVTGQPELPLSIDSTFAIIDTVTSDTVSEGSYFTVIYKGTESEPIPWDATSLHVKRAVESIATVLGDVCVSRYPSPNALGGDGYRWAIRLENIDDDPFELDISSYGMSFSTEGSLQIDVMPTTDSVLDGWSPDEGDIDICAVRSATYINGSGTKSLRFRFQVLHGDDSDRLEVADEAQLILSNTDSISLLVNGPEQSSILADISLDGKSFNPGHSLTVNTDRPRVTSVIPQTSTTVDGQYTVGDVLYFEVTFDKVVEVNVGLELTLNAGENAVARYFSGSGTNTLLLEYLVQEGDIASKLDFRNNNSLVAQNTEGGRLPEDGFVRRKSTLPSTEADLDLSHVDQLSDNYNIEIDGSKPILIGVSIHENDKRRTLIRGDILSIQVQFSAPVEVDVADPPLLGLILQTPMGATTRWAEYSSGSGTSTIIFAYSILLGDTSTPLDLKYSRICRANNCSDLEGLIMRQSSAPTLNVDLDEGFSDQGITIASTADKGVTIDTSLSAVTTVDSVQTALDGGVYLPGTVVDIQVKFTDEVFVAGVPTLWLNTISNAVYTSGHATDTLSFKYTTSVYDNVSLDWALSSPTDSAIVCLDLCSISNRNQVLVDARFVGGTKDIEDLSPIIVLDPSPPKVISVESNKEKSPFCHPICSYTAGEEIMISVVFDRSLIVLGTEIFLLLDVNDETEGSRAIFVPQQSTANKLTFVYTVRQGHSSNGTNLKYKCEPLQCAIELGPGTTIKGDANRPTVDVDLSLPSHITLISADESNPIIIDTSDQPQVVAVSSVAPNARYSPGDAIDIVVEFSKNVVVTGEPFITLDVGSHDGIARYQSGSGSNNIIFKYTVGFNQQSFDLDYVDVYSLYVGSDGLRPGSIKQASTHPTIDAILDLPIPATSGSLSHSSDIIIDSRIPYITSITATTLHGSQICNMGEAVLVQVQFSRPIVVNGIPSVMLETGIQDRLANYESQLDERTLQFKYIIQLGDSSPRLDYWSNEELLPSSFSSFQLNGGWIRSSSANPILDADVHLNPVGGFLDGDRNKIVNEGIAYFRDLKVGQRGKDHQIRYSSSIPGGVVEAQEIVEVGISIEYEVHGDLNNRDHGDSYGHAVAIHGDLCAIGAPRKRNPTNEIQVLTVHSEASTIEHEVQMITTTLNKQEAVIEIQEFSTCASVGEAIGGSFELTFKAEGTYEFASHAIEFNFDVTAEKLKTTLEGELSMDGLISTSRSVNSSCESFNAWTWSVTFLDSSNRSGILETNGDGLIGNGVYITSTSITRAAHMLSGSFKLTNPSNKHVSRLIPFNASATFVREAIENDLSMSVLSVHAENTDTVQNIPELGRRWVVFFSHHMSEYGYEVNVPELEVSGEGLAGTGASAWTYTTFEGRAPLSGSFALSFRGSGFSNFISHDSSEEELAEALESLESINDVRVSDRMVITDEAGKFGVAWTITFISVNELTEYGWILDPNAVSSGGNLPTLQINSHLIGWNAGCKVESATGRGREDTQAQWMKQNMGDDGLNAGIVDVFRRRGETWIKEQTLVASDYAHSDLFGSSLSITDRFLLIGAPSKQVNGNPEQQKLTCTGPASDGFFTLGFRGFKSLPIPHDATLDEMKAAIIGTYGETKRIHSFPRLIFSTDSNEWDGSSRGFCSGSETSVSITFLTPDGGGISTSEHLSGDIEDIAIISRNLNGAIVTISESRAGTTAPMGKDSNHAHATGKQAGAAYLFQRNVACVTCVPSWTEYKKFTPLHGFDDATDAALFGWSAKFVPATDTENALVIIGSPGFDQDSGRVYVFEQVDDDWVVLDTLTNDNWNDNKIKGGRFGISVDGDQDTILVGSPKHLNGKGAVFVFRRAHDPKNNKYLASQVIYGPGDVEDDNQFGHSISLSGNKATICAPYKTVPAIHIHSHSPSIKRNAGSCYVYSRRGPTVAFQLEQQLVPSNVLQGDRFGWGGVSMNGSKILVGQLEEFTDKLSPPKPIQVIKTYCKAPPCPKPDLSLFRLGWINDDEAVWTPYLPVDTTANRLRDAIEESLFTDETSVSRSVLPDSRGGYMWRITFDSYKQYLKDGNKIPKFHCQVSQRSSLSCSVIVENDIPPYIRSKTHLFDFDESTNEWTEQSFLFPGSPQRQDLMGASVAIHGNYAIVGAPNRDLVNINSGAAILIDTSFLNLNFVDSPFTCAEGDTLDVEIRRSSSDNVFQIVSIRTIDRNAEDALQQYIDDLYSIRSLELHPYDKTSAEVLTGTTALGRNQYYGSDERRSVFINGQYDFQGISDYEHFIYEDQFGPQDQSTLAHLNTNDDDISEKPENTTIHVNLRGMFPSQLGRLHATVTIADDTDGKNSAGESQYQLLDDGISHENFSRLGAAVDYNNDSRFSVVASDKASGIDSIGNHVHNVGSAHVFRKKSNGWVHIQTLVPRPTDVTPNMLFGHSVAIDTPYGKKDEATIVIGCPGSAVAYIYSFHKDTNTWFEQGRLSVSEATLPEHKFGQAVALYGHMAFIGAPGIETVYAFRRSFLLGQGYVQWELYATLRSSDYDFDIYGQDYSIPHIHRQSFGIALATNRRSLLVGAPFADYGNRGDVNTRENFDTDGIDNVGLGKGKVYAFHSQPHVQLVKLISDENIKSGSFRVKLLDHQGMEEEYSGLIQHDASAEMFREALELMSNVGEVKVERNKIFENNSYEVSWRITFVSSFEDEHPLLLPVWSEAGCSDCTQLGVTVLSTIQPHLVATAIQYHQHYIQEGYIQPRDVTSSDLFGTSIDIDGPQAIIGSKHSSTKTRTAWNFETGDLTGWSATGDAFQFQPTYGDNSRHRAGYDRYEANSGHSIGEPQSSGLDGRYYIGTFEKRPGDKDESYQAPSKLYDIGSIQGDEPTGTLTSDPFLILGDRIHFMIGGGCNYQSVYVELLIDGIPALRTTGKCNEKMEQEHFDVRDFISRSGQIRVVDKGSDQWDHINFDNVQFSWDLGGSRTCLSNNWGECTEGGGALPKLSHSEKQQYTGKEESARSGAAYMFYRECPPLTDLTDSPPSCTWIEQERLIATDKRAGNEFGVSVSVDNTQGVAIVGSSNSPAYGLYQEPIYAHPHSNGTMFDLPIPENLSHIIKTASTYSTTGGSIRVMDYLARFNNIPTEKALKFTEQAGMVYVFLRESALYGPSGEIIRKAYWRTSEHGRIAPPDISARDHFGHSIALGGSTAVMGAIGHDGYAKEGGGAFAYDMEWIRVKFASVEFVAVEGIDPYIKIFLQRDLAWSSAVYSIRYSTSDLSAVGVDTFKYEKCMKLNASERDGCGDYEQAAGEVTFDEGEEFAYFKVRIMDDLCTEKHMEYIQLNLHQFGGSPIRGENYRAQIRIDDDDWEGIQWQGGIS